MTASKGKSRGRAFIAGAVALAALVVAGDVWLWRVFVAEHADAQTQIASQGRLIEEAARVVVVDELESRFNVARLHISDVANDPALDDPGYILVMDGGRQLLPRVLDKTPAQPSFAWQLYQQIQAC